MSFAVATPGQRAGLIAATFIVGYLAFSIPALIAGVATTHFGLHMIAPVSCAALAALVAATVGIQVFHPGAMATRSAPGSRAELLPTG